MNEFHEPQPLGETPAGASSEPTCPQCGEPNGVEFTPGLSPFVASMASRVLCDACWADNHDREERVAEFERRRIHRIRINETLPRELRDVRSKNSQAPAEAKAAALEWIRDGGGLFLGGPVGTGKTYLAAAAVRVALGNHDVRWASVPSMLTAALAAFGDDDRRTAMSSITGTGAVVLDDLDKMKPSEWAAAQIFAAIDNRVNAGTRLLITSNKSPGELQKFIGGDLGNSIASRIVGYCRVVHIPGRDLRVAR